MTGRRDHHPGEPAPVSGVYRLFNVLGTRTQIQTHIERGSPLPDAPRGFGWQLERPADGLARTDKPGVTDRKAQTQVPRMANRGDQRGA